MQEDREQSADAIGNVFVIGLSFVAFTLGAIALACGILSAGPSIGDIVVFDPAHKHHPEEAETRVQALLAGESWQASPRGTCAMRAETMMATGGSLIVEAYEPGQARAYRVHWSGGPADDGPSACGTAVDLFLAREDLAALQGAADSMADNRPGPTLPACANCQ